MNTRTPQQTPLGPNAGPQAWHAELVTWLPIIAGRVVRYVRRPRPQDEGRGYCHPAGRTSLRMQRSGNLCNPALASQGFHILPYQGMGSGIPRAVEDWPPIEFVDDRQGSQFRVTLKRTEEHVGGVNGGLNGGVNTTIGRGDLVNAIEQNPGLRAPALGKLLGVTPKRVGHWIKQHRDGGKIEFVGTSRLAATDAFDHHTRASQLIPTHPLTHRRQVRMVHCAMEQHQ